MAGELIFGLGSSQIKAQLAGGFESSPTAPGFYVYAKFNKLSIGAILAAFDIEVELPEALAETGFPEGLVAGMSMPGSKYIEQLDTTVQSGFALKGKFVFLGLKMFCDIKLDLPSSFRLEAKFDPIRIGGGALELTGSGGSKGPYLLVELGVKKFKVTIDCHVQILAMGVGAKINIDHEGFQFVVEGQIGGLFEVSLEVKAPYGKLGDMASNEWMIKTCLSDSVMDKVKTGAVDEVNDCTNVTTHLQNRNNEVNGEATSWFDKVMSKLNEEKMELLDLEKEFDAEIAELEESKAKLDEDCVRECQKEREWVGGFGMQTCKIGSKSIECPYWIKEKTLRESPYCLSDCESSKFSFKSWINGLVDSGKLIGLEKEMQVKSVILDEVQDLLYSSKSLVEFAEIASKKVGELSDAVADAAAAIKKYAVEHLFMLKHLCLTANLEVASKGLCFIVDAEFFIGGEGGRRVVLENKEICLDRKFAITIGAEIAKEAFSGLKSLKDKVAGVTDFFDKSGDKAKAVQEAAEEAEKRDDCQSAPAKKCHKGRALKKLTHYRSSKHTSIPDIIVRNRKSMMAMRDIFDMDNDDIRAPQDASTKDDIEDLTAKYKYAINIDPTSLQNSAEGHKCDRTRQVLDLYTGVVDSLNMLEGKNTGVKKQYEAFIKGHEKKLEKLERKVHNRTVSDKMNAEDAENAMFYVKKAKAGVAAWKANFDTRYVLVDQSSLKNWRGFMAESIQEKGMDVAAFMSVLDTASSESAQRAEIPTGGVTQTMANAQQIIRSLLATDDSTFSSKATEIKNLSDQVSWLNKAKASMSCFQDE